MTQSDFDQLPWQDRDFGDENDHVYDDWDGLDDEDAFWDEPPHYDDDVIWDEEDIDDGGDENRSQGDGFFG